MEALKAAWSVKAGLHQQHELPEYFRQWAYTSSDFEKDRATPDDQPTIFQKLDEEAHTYARSITDPRRLNYVKLEFIWI